MNFGIVYGIGAHSLSQDIGVSYVEAKAYIDEYLAHYSQRGGVYGSPDRTGQGGRLRLDAVWSRRPLPELRASNGVTRSFGERVARNMPIQGTAADIIKRAMIRVYQRLREEGLQARLILQVHDELIVEAPREEAERVSALLRRKWRARRSWR